METSQPANQPNSSSYILAIHPHRVFISYCKMYKYHLSHIPTYHFLSSATEIPPSKSFLFASGLKSKRSLPTHNNIPKEQFRI